MAFKYRPRSMDQVRARADQSGGQYDRWYKGQFKLFKAPEGDNRLRILPATWDKADNYGIDIYLHYSVGPDNQRYLCPKMMKVGECPVCEAGAPFKERALELEREGKKDEAELARKKASRFRAGKQILMWVIDRAHPDEGPLLYGMPWTMEKDISDRSIDRETRALLNVDDPENGYDVYFKRTGTTETTKYTSVELAREPSPLSKKAERADKWLSFIEKNKIPELLKIYDYDHIAKAFRGAGKSKDDDDSDDDDADDDKKKSTRRASHDDDDDPPPRRRAKDDDDDAPKGRSRTADADDDDDSLDDDPADRKAKKKAKAPADDDDDSDDDDAPPPKKAKKAPVEDDDDDADDDAPPKKSKKVADDDDDDPPPRKAKAKAKPADDDDSDDDSDDDDIEERPPTKKAKKKVSRARDDDDIPF